MQVEHLRIRRRKERLLASLCRTAICFSLGMLFILLSSLVATGFYSFFQYRISLNIKIPSDAGEISTVNYYGALRDSLLEYFPNAQERQEKKDIARLLSKSGSYVLYKHYDNNPEDFGKSIIVSIPVADLFDQLLKGRLDQADLIDTNMINVQQIEYLDNLKNMGKLGIFFNSGLFLNYNSRFPEIAGLRGALKGTFLALLICAVVCIPIGIAAGVYLEEYGRKSKWAGFIEVNTNNLAAVPSIVFGLLALAILLERVGIPRSAPLAAGIVLGVMTLPIVIISTRTGIRAVPVSIREAVLAVGATKQQMIFSHLLPYASPRIMTGVIIGIAQAMGETAPLLLIGMNSFVTTKTGGMLSPSSALPTQIYIWAGSPEKGFVSLAAAAMIVLLVFLLLLNSGAIYLRQRYEGVDGVKFGR